LNKVVQEIGQKVYAEAAAKQQAEQKQETPKGESSSKNGEKVVDAEFEEKEDTKKTKDKKE